jgi:hypothetical protein
MFDFNENDAEQWGLWDGQCQACDRYGRVDDMILCESCGTRLERDFIRQRAWDYAASAFGLADEAREELRRQVIAQFGEKLELVAPPEQE